MSQAVWSRRRALTLMTIGAAAPMVSACVSPKYTLRYRLTVEAVVDGLLRTGSSVVDYSVQDEVSWLPSEGGLTASARGEATAVDLGRGRVLAALMSGMSVSVMTGEPYMNLSPWSPTELLSNHYGLEYKWEGGRNLAVERLLKIGPGVAVQVPKARYPALVATKDGRDVRDLQHVLPADIPAVFGGEVSLRSVSVAMTHGPLEYGRIEKLLPWLIEQPETGPGIKSAGSAGIPIGKHAFIRR